MLNYLLSWKGFEFGSGFSGTKLRGSQHNDVFEPHGSETAFLRTASNHAGGTLGGISNGSDVFFRVAIKPVSTIGQKQTTAQFDGSPAALEAKGRHDPCVLPRAPPLVEAMAALVLADAALIQRTRSPPESFSSEARKLAQAKQQTDDELGSKRQRVE
jgi:chorismate synthase